MLVSFGGKTKKNNKYIQLFMHTNKSHTCALIDTRAFHATEPFNKRSTIKSVSSPRQTEKKIKKNATTTPSAPIVQQSNVKL